MVTSISLGSYLTCGDFPADSIGTMITRPSSTIRPIGMKIDACVGVMCGRPSRMGFEVAMR